MLKRYHQAIGAIYLVTDVIILSLSWIASFWIRFYIPVIPVTKGFPPFPTYAALLPLIVLLWASLFSFNQAYASGKILRRTHEAHKILRTHALALLVFVTLTYLFSEYKYSRVVLLYFAFLSALGLVVARLSLRNLIRYLRKRGIYQRRLLAVGEGALMDSLLYTIQKFPEIGVKPVAILTSTGQPYREKLPCEVRGSYKDLGKILDQMKIHEVLIALPRKDTPELDPILNRIHDETVDVRIVPDLHEYVTLGCEVEDFNGHPILNLNQSPLSGFSVFAKRSTDVLGAVVFFVIFSPLLLALAVVTKITSKGPVLYSQKRMGLDGKTFKIYKFRSMKVDDGTPSKTPGWTVQNDPRRTAWGSFMRATSLDELPQFWNVFKGDMSLVGPRPEQPYFVSQFKKEIPKYMLRHKVKAGLTGWAQINGWRGDTNLRKRIECDLYYIQNWSYWLDIKIIWLTIWKGFRSPNAY